MVGKGTNDDDDDDEQMVSFAGRIRVVEGGGGIKTFSCVCGMECVRTCAVFGQGVFRKHLD